MYSHIKLVIIFTVLSFGATAKSIYDPNKKIVICEQPLPVFTLGGKSNPTSQQIINLCDCIWESLPQNGWEREIAIKIRNNQDPGYKGQAFVARFGKSVKNCGGMSL